MAQESTAINALIHLVQAPRIDSDEDPVPELFSMAPPKSVPQRVIGMPANPQPVAAPVVAPPRPAAPPRVASGTNPPPVNAAALVTTVPVASSKSAVSKKVVYRAPVVQHEDEQTELWNNADVQTTPAVPALAPHLATVIAQPTTAPVVPSILRGPVAPGPDPRVMQAARAAHEAAQQRGADPRVDAAAAARHAASEAAQARVEQAAQATHAAQAQYASASRAQPAHPVSSSRQESRLMASPQYPAIKMTAAMQSAMDSVPRTPTASPAPYLVAREMLSSAVRSWGTLVAVTVIALGVGAYLAIASKSEDKPQGPTDRDRAIAIMNGTAQPEAEPVVVKAPAPTVVSAPVEAVTTAWKPAPEAPAEAEKIVPTAEPIEEPAGTAPAAAATPAPGTAATPAPGTAATPAPDTAATPAIDVAASDDDAIDENEIEMEPTAVAKTPSRRAARSARAARKAKTVAAAEAPIKETASARASNDPVLAILAEKPKPLFKTVEKTEKPKKEEKKKPVKEANLANATEIAAARGAAPAKGSGKIAISSDKPALIFVDGRPTGKSAPSAFVIPAGDHQITLLDPTTKKAKTATVQVAVNKTVSIRRDFN